MVLKAAERSRRKTDIEPGSAARGGSLDTLRTAVLAESRRK